MRGQALLAVTFSLLFVFAAMGLSIDLGWAYYLKIRVQTAADAAATAAAVYAKNNGDTCSTITCGTSYSCAGVSPPTTSLQAGCLYATSDAPPTFTATMLENNTTPPGVTGNAPSMWIKATVSTSAPNLFLFGSGYTTASIAAQAYAGVTTLPGSSCIYVIGTGSIADALTITGTSSITTSNCGVYVNSSNAAALYLNGGPTLTAQSINVVGGTSISSSSSASPSPTTGVSAVTDPLASLPAPTFSGCNQTNYSLSHSDSGSLTPVSGIYVLCGGMTVKGNATLTLAAGIYVLNGGGLTISNSATVTGDGVMFYNTATGSNTIAPVSITGNPVVTLSAPTSGTYEGVVFYQDRTQTYAAANVISNSSTGLITGAYYFPTTAFDFTGNVNTPTYAAFIAKTVAITGSSTLENDTTGTYTGLTRTNATLIQ